MECVQDIFCPQTTHGPAMQPAFTEPPLVLGRGQSPATNPLPCTKMPARFRPRPIGKPNFGLTRHFAPDPLRSVSISQASFPLHFVPSVVNCRDSQKTSGASQCLQRPRCSAYRPGGNMAARLRPAKASALTVSTASFRFTALHETARPHWQDQVGLILRRQTPRRTCRRAHDGPCGTHPSRRRPAAPCCRRSIRFVGFTLARLARVFA